MTKPSIALDETQQQAWSEAQDLWGVRMHEARAVPDANMGTFAWFGFPPSISIDPVEAQRMGANTELASVFAHELGHHVLSPSTRLASLKISQQMARALTASSLDTVRNIGERAHSLGNLWSDMLINVRVAELQRRSAPAEEPGMLRLWTILSKEPTQDRQWWVVLRAYEELWGLPSGRLCSPQPPVHWAEPALPTATHRGSLAPVQPNAADEELDEMEQAVAEFSRLIDSDPETDATFLADTVRTFGSDPIRGALRFGMVLAPYVLADDRSHAGTDGAARVCSGDPDAAAPSALELDEVLRDARLRETPRHPALEAPVSTTAGAPGADTQPGAAGDPGPSGGQSYGLADTLELYSALDQSTVIESWYAAEARTWVRPYRQPSVAPTVTGQLPGPLDQWELTDEPGDIDWPATLAQGARVIPGVTTRQRTQLDDDAPTATESVLLDLYIDSSGSMPSPGEESPAILAGTILVLSVLRGGGRVRVTSFSGPAQVAGSNGFTGRRSEAIAALLTFFSGGTTFPLDLLEERYDQKTLRREDRSAAGPIRRHLVVLSDDGLESMFGAGQADRADIAADVRTKLDTATLLVLDSRRTMADLASGAGYDLDYLDTLDAAPAACARLARIIAGDEVAVHG